MATSFVRRILGLIAVASLLSACSPAASGTGGNIGFAVSSTDAPASIAPAVRVGSVRVLSRRVNLQQPVIMGAAGADVTVTFALRQREGTTYTMDAESLEPHAAVPYSYPSPSPSRTVAPLLQASEPSRVTLEDDGALSCWTDEASRRVLVQAFGANGAWRGSPVVVSPESMEVFGAPRVATADGRRVVVTFFVSDEERFQLVAASLEPVR